VTALSINYPFALSTSFINLKLLKTLKKQPGSFFCSNSLSISEEYGLRAANTCLVGSRNQEHRKTIQGIKGPIQGIQSPSFSRYRTDCQWRTLVRIYSTVFLQYLGLNAIQSSTVMENTLAQGRTLALLARSGTRTSMINCIARAFISSSYRQSIYRMNCGRSPKWKVSRT
jgi:hypothetical protein